MGLTHTRAMEVAEEAAIIATDMVDLFVRMERFLDKNSDFSIDWAAGQKPAFLNEDSAGNLDGAKFTRAQLSNAIGSIYQTKQLLRGETPQVGDHLGTLNQLAEV